MKIKNLIAIAAICLVGAACTKNEEKTDGIAYEIEGIYTGPMQTEVKRAKAEEPVVPANVDVKITAQSADVITIRFPESGNGSMTTPAWDLKDVKVVKSNDTFTLSHNDMEFSIGETAYVFAQFTGSVVNGKLIFSCNNTAAAMAQAGMSITYKFNGDLK